jgi:hypothetical protein
MFPEALVIHHLDDLDSKLESMRAQFITDKNRVGEWTARNRALGRELLKPAATEGLPLKLEPTSPVKQLADQQPKLSFRDGQKNS